MRTPHPSLGLPFVLALLSAACGGAQDETPPDDEEPPIVCGDFQVTAEDGTCHGIGVPPGTCGAGFVSDLLGGCVAVLPDQACPPGTMALPGEDVCRDVAPCPDGTWGDIPVDASTQFVDAGFVGASDGSMAAPWTTVGDAVAAAAPDAIVAIAEGTYAQDVTIENKPVRLWGRCPALVSIVGGNQFAAITVGAGADGTEIRDLGVTSASNGIFVSGSIVLAHRLWVHDMPGRGINFQNSFGPTNVSISESLVERVTGVGIFQGASTGVIERSVVRDIVPQPDGRAGAVSAEGNPMTLEPPVITLTSSVFERGAGVGLNLGSATVFIQDSLVRDFVLEPDGLFGMGLSLYESVPGIGGNAHIVGTVFERTSYLGVLALNTATTVERTVIRDVTPRADGTFGDALAIVSEGGVANATVSDSRIERATRAGISTFGSPAALTGSSVACAGFALNFEMHEGMAGAIQDGGGNACGCEEAAPCQAVSSSLEPPVPPN